MKNSLKEHERVIRILDKLSKAPPRVLILEGGDLFDREKIAKYWCMLFSCKGHIKPCLECKNCVDILNNRFPDLIWLDGKDKSIQKKEIEVIQREKDLMPRYGRFKITVFNEAQNLTISSANSLLKWLEEPRDKNLFVLLVPYRLYLLPTIQSRGFILTLKWKSPVKNDLHRDEVIEQLIGFWKTGKGLFKITQKKMDRDLVQLVVFALQQALFDSVSQGEGGVLNEFFASRISKKNLWNLTYFTDHALYMLMSNVSPSTTLEWLALHFYVFLSSK